MANTVSDARASSRPAGELRRSPRRQPIGRARLRRVSTFEERRALRGAWPIRAVPLEQEGAVDRRVVSTVDERLALVHTLTLQLWAFAGRPLPTYSRAEMPGRIVRRR